MLALMLCMSSASAGATPSLTEQLAAQADAYAGSGYPEDEELLSEQSRDASGMPLPQGAQLRCAGCTRVLSAELHGQRQVLQQFDPHSGESRTLLVLQAHVVTRGVATPNGVLLEVYETRPGTPGRVHAVLLPPRGRPLSVVLPLVRVDAQVLALTDGSVLFLGGRIDGSDGERTRSVQRVDLIGGSLRAVQMEDFPGPTRWGFSAVALADGGALLLGGSTDRYLSCRPESCMQDSWLLPEGAITWQPGPKLTQPRADAAAGRLPDGSVLVAGGWAQTAQGNLIASASSERWIGSGDFLPAPPMAMAVARGTLLPGMPPLIGALLADPHAVTVQSFALASGQWRLAADLTEPVSGVHGPWADAEGGWLLGWGSSGWRAPRLRSPGRAISRSAELDVGVRFPRDAVAWLPGIDERAALVVGGMPLSAPHAEATVAGLADRLATDGRQWSLPSLQVRRAGARVFRLPEGALLVTGGFAEGDYGDRRAKRLPVVEYLASEQADAWQVLADFPIGHYGQDGDGQMLVLSETGELRRVAIEITGNGPTLRIDLLPRLPELRVERDRHAAPLPIGLVDGRRLIVDGYTPVARIAVLDRRERAAEMGCVLTSDAADGPPLAPVDPEDCIETDDPEFDPDSDSDSDHALDEDMARPASEADPPRAAPGDWPDVYGGYGRLERARRYLILDPGASEWRLSALSTYEGDELAVLPDGRVVRIGLLPSTPGDDGPRPVVIEISSADGNAWQSLPSLPASFWGLRVLVVDGELFAYGRIKAHGADGVFHFDFAQDSWRIVRDSERYPLRMARWLNLFLLRLDDGRRLLLPQQLPEG